MMDATGLPNLQKLIWVGTERQKSALPTPVVSPSPADQLALQGYR